MRRQHFLWTYLTGAIVFTAYGVFSIIYNVSHQKDIPVLGLIFAILGGVLLLLLFAFFLVDLFRKKNNPPTVEKPAEPVEEPKVVEEAEDEPEEPTEDQPAPKLKTEVSYGERPVHKREPVSRSFDGGSGYVKLVGYGPILRVEGAEILDMRSNTYYRIDGNIVKRSGSGPVYEISGNRIRSAFGSYLFEISGGSVYKTFGGFYASISGGYLQTYDLAEKYEISGSLSIKQQLAVVALLFEAQ